MLSDSAVVAATSTTMPVPEGIADGTAPFPALHTLSVEDCNDNDNHDDVNDDEAYDDDANDDAAHDDDDEADDGGDELQLEAHPERVNNEPQEEEDEDALIYMPCGSKCKICCALPFRRSTKDDESEGILWDDASPWDWDGGLYDLVCQMNGREQYPKLPSDIAKITVEGTMKHLDQLKEELMQAGLQKHYNQNYCGESLSSSRVIAPFDFSELELGQLLGNGGFSSVSEVARIRPHSRSSNFRRFHPLEEKSRQYISNNLFCQIETTDPSRRAKKLLPADKSSGKNHKAPNDRPGQYCSQYAVKHLRNRLVTRTPEKFKRAAIDLVLEAQLLLFMDHPNIVGLHGWCGDGPKAFASGDPRGFFLILDKLSLSLEERMSEWRNTLLKFQRQSKRQEIAQERRLVVTNWARKALRRNQGEDPKSITLTKAALSMQNLLLERLKVVHKIGLAVQYMHSKRLIHRDLKVSNVGFDIHGQVKLFDFGLSRLLPSSSDHHVNSSRSDVGLLDGSVSTASNTVTGSMTEIYVMSRVGTKFYMAPEVRRKEPYSLPADVYSFGVILWEVLALSTPREFYHHERDRLAKMTREKADKILIKGALDQPGVDVNKGWLPICPCWPVGIIELVTASMSSDPMDRPTMDQVLVVLQKHIDALSGNTANDYSIGTKQQSTSSRVDLTAVDLRFLDKKDIGI